MGRPGLRTLGHLEDRKEVKTCRSARRSVMPRADAFSDRWRMLPNVAFVDAWPRKNHKNLPRWKYKISAQVPRNVPLRLGWGMSRAFRVVAFNPKGIEGAHQGPEGLLLARRPVGSLRYPMRNTGQPRVEEKEGVGGQNKGKWNGIPGVTPSPNLLLERSTRSYMRELDPNPEWWGKNPAPCLGS